MPKKAEQNGYLKDLRSRAKEKLKNVKKNQPQLTREETNIMVEELHTHQIELEMQNEELLRIQLELIESNSKYLELYDFAPVGYLTISENGLILKANLNAAALFKEERLNLINKPFSAYILKDHKDQYYFHRKKLFETRQNQKDEIRMVNKSGQVFWASLVCDISEESSGGGIFCRTIITDISDRKKNEELLKQKMRELEDFNKYFIDRELQMIKLKKEINSLLAELNREQKYDLPKE
jgi:PAS domain S-box-containing protein